MADRRVSYSWNVTSSEPYGPRAEGLPTIGVKLHRNEDVWYLSVIEARALAEALVSFANEAERHG